MIAKLQSGGGEDSETPLTTEDGWMAKRSLRNPLSANGRWRNDETDRFTLTLASLTYKGTESAGGGYQLKDPDWVRDTDETTDALSEDERLLNEIGHFGV